MTPTHIEEWLRAPVDALWEQALTHPFVRGLGAGTLPLSAFRYFIGQDAVYLRDFSRVLAMAAAHSPDRAEQQTLLAHAQSVHVVEAALHEELAPALGLSRDTLLDTIAGPVTQAYANHLVRLAWEGTPTMQVAAVLPCYWIYRAVGERLRANRPEEPLYRAWIDTYSGSEYGTAVGEMMNIVEKRLEETTQQDRDHAAEAFRYSVGCEYWFWEQAWREGHLPFAGGLTPQGA